MTRFLGRALQRCGMSSTGILIAPGIPPPANSLAGRTSTNSGLVFPARSSRSCLVSINVGCFLAASASLHVTPPVWKLDSTPPGDELNNPNDEGADSLEACTAGAFPEAVASL